jgi:hypothetical protein
VDTKHLFRSVSLESAMLLTPPVPENFASPVYPDPEPRKQPHHKKVDIGDNKVDIGDVQIEEPKDDPFKAGALKSKRESTIRSLGRLPSTS